MGEALQVLARRHLSAHPLAHDKTCQDTNTLLQQPDPLFEYLELGLTWARPNSLPLRRKPLAR